MIFFRFILAAVFLCAVVAAGADSKPPNILFILTDDHGWPTLGCYGSDKVPTPHLDSLARDGVRFTDAYVMPQCTPTRAAFLSGQHTARNGMWHVIPWYGSPWARVSEPGYREQFPREMPNLPKALRKAGYRTGMAGKWHLTTGADGDYVHLRAADAYGFDFVAPRGPGSQNEGDKWVDHFTDQAILFIRESNDAPWFFYLAHHTLHGVVSAPDDLVKKHREAGAPEAGMFNATYLAAIEHLDNSIGRLLAALDETKQGENTLIVFLSDNGGVDTHYHVPGQIGDPSDGGVPLKVKAQEFDNAPLRAGKGSPYEGGIRVPCLLRWPEKVKAGQLIETPVHVIDWMPTLLAAAGSDVSSAAACDGMNLLPLLNGGTIPDRPLYFYMPLYDLRWASTPCAVIREGDWKLIEYFGDSFDKNLNYQAGHKLELYNLRTDLGETQNVANSGAGVNRAKAMQSKMHAWLKSIPAEIPGENRHFIPQRMLEETKEKQPWNP